MADSAPELVGEGVVVRIGSRVVVEAPHIRLGVGITAIVGVNGSGKSTLVGALATTRAPHQGSLVIDGNDVSTRAGLRGARRSLGFLPQTWDLPAGTRVIDAFRHGAWLHRVRPAGTAIDRAIHDLDLGAHRAVSLGRLSAGTQRRVAIGQATLHRPRILLLDEPTAGLDVGQRHRLWSWLGGVARASVVAVVTHDVDEVIAHADQVVVVADGVAGRLDAPSRSAIMRVVS